MLDKKESSLVEKKVSLKCFIGIKTSVIRHYRKVEGNSNQNGTK
jgi:hypothetical protein